MINQYVKKIPWNFNHQDQLLKWNHLHTVCEESKCPNRHECSTAGIATFLIGGRICTRACKFCHIETGKPPAYESIRQKETDDLLKAAEQSDAKYVVITSVARDDDEISLAEHFAELTLLLKKKQIDVELLIPDFHLKYQILDIVAKSSPLVIAHNMETVNRLSEMIRPQAGYERSLKIFEYFHKNWPKIILKSGFMTGLGETMAEIDELLEDMKSNKIEIVTVGQYMRPSQKQEPVRKYYTLREFKEIEMLIKEKNFKAWEVGPFVRSSYLAAKTMEKVIRQKNHET